MDSRLHTLYEILKNDFDISNDKVTSIISEIAAETGKTPEQIIQEALTSEYIERNKLNPH